MNEPDIWAVDILDCKKEMQPVTPKFAMIHNDVSKKDVIHVDCTLLDLKPDKIIDGVNGAGIVDTFIQVGFWKVKTGTK